MSANLPPPAPVETAVAPAEVPGLSGLLTVVVGVVVVAALYFGREVFIPIVLAILLSFVLAPLVDLLRRIRIPRAPAVILAVLVALGLIAGIGGLIGMQVAQLAGTCPGTSDDLGQGGRLAGRDARAGKRADAKPQSADRARHQGDAGRPRDEGAPKRKPRRRRFPFRCRSAPRPRSRSRKTCSGRLSTRSRRPGSC
jgi:hypothetical protein